MGSDQDADDRAFLETLREEFFESAPSELEAWEENLLNFERSGDGQALKELKRLVHSMKGSAQAIGLLEAGEFLHCLEAWLIDNLPSKPRTELVSHCLQAVDGFRTYFAALSDGDDSAPHAERLRQHLA
jgi:chemotaxis protein histidine kinase CheA